MKKVTKKAIKSTIPFLIIPIALAMFYFYNLFKQKLNLIQPSEILASLNYLVIIQLTASFIIIFILLVALWYTFKNYLVMEKNALIDPLTQIYNRKALFHELRVEMEKSERYNSPTSIAIIDIDFFKKYNDTNGHVAGDKLLKKFKGLFQKYLRHYDIYGRYGGEEFLLVLPRTKLKDAKLVCERLREGIEKTKFYGEKNLPHKNVTISTGVAEYTGKTKMQHMNLVKKADKQLYKAKEEGRNRVKG